MSTPVLRLDRLVIIKDGNRAYDESFHAGLNIIRGTNGSGKSTIMDFIFYALGGELKDWKEYALLCDEVIAEIHASGTILTIKREISQVSLRPMQIFFGPLEAAVKSGIDGWSLFPYLRAEGIRRSFSQVLFETLGIPEIPSDENSNITIHQILRLMYVDQSTPYQRIFRSELITADSRDTRSAIAELLCGVGGYELYSKRLLARKLDKELSEAKTRFSNLLTAASSLEEDFNSETIAAKIVVLNQKQELLYKEIEEIESDSAEQAILVKDANIERRALYEQSAKIRHELVQLERQQKSLELESSDSEQFIAHLNSMLLEYENSALTFLELGTVHFEKCPACFSDLQHHTKDNCSLCGHKTSELDKQSKALAIKLDIEGQLNESRRIQAVRIEQLSDIAKRLKSLRLNYSNIAKRYNELVRAPVDGRSALVSERNREIGRIEARIAELEKLKNISDELTQLSIKKADISDQLQKLRDQIQALEVSVEKRRAKVLTEISENTKYFLQLDLREHNDFDALEKFSFNFSEDWFAVNGEPNISTSASGMVVIKNSLFMGIIKSSIEDQQMLFPRFLLLDNVEDKGMVGERVKHFQKTIADWSNQQTSPHQIIITTSTINPELEHPKFVVGESYTRQNRTLAIGRTNMSQSE